MASSKYFVQRYLPIVLVIGIMIIAIIILVSLARAIFFSGSSNTSTVDTTDVATAALLSTAADRAVQVTVRGPIVANEDFRSYQMTVSPNARTVETFEGYLGNTLQVRTISNNTAAYEQFVFALERADLVKGDAFDDEGNDVRGICASGELYEFRLLKDDETVNLLWTTTCSGSRGSLDASVSQLMTLFERQIPESSDIIDDLDI